jgi:hypothetical protein
VASKTLRALFLLVLLDAIFQTPLCHVFPVPLPSFSMLPPAENSLDKDGNENADLQND